MTKTLIAWAFVAAIIGAGVDRFFVTRADPGRDHVAFEIQDVKWAKTTGTTYRTQQGTARVAGDAATATGHYLVLVAFIRSQRMNPANPPDTTWTSVVTTNGSATVGGDDQAYGCNWSATIRPPNCTREFHELGATWRIAGWVRLAEPSADSNVTR